MARRLRKRATVVVLFYAAVTAVIVAAFAWQMAHGICPVP
jgi:preprotein translocase subunit SecE